MSRLENGGRDNLDRLTYFADSCMVFAKFEKVAGDWERVGYLEDAFNLGNVCCGAELNCVSAISVSYVLNAYAVDEV